MERTQEASGGGQAEAWSPEEPLKRPDTEYVEAPPPPPPPPPEAPDGHPRAERTGREAADAEPREPREPREEKPQPPAPCGTPRLPPLGLGYGAFRHLGSSSREPPSPSPSRDGEAEQPPWAASGEPAPGAWAPVELQVDVRVKPVGAAGASRSPSPAPSTRFLTVPVPESPAFARRSAPAPPRLPRAPSPGSTWGRGSPLAATPTTTPSELIGAAEGSAVPPDSPTCRCRCQGSGLTKEDARLLQSAGMDSKKLPRAVTLIGLPLYMKSLRWALVIMAVFLAVCTVAIVALASRGGARCQPCPRGWLWSQEHCYYLSEEAQDWESSQAFCSAHHATLPLLNHTQDFLRKYQITKDSWVGAQRGPEGWHWTDGVPLPPQLFPEDSEDHPDFSCGSLEEGRLVARDCSSPKPWVCARRVK